MSADANTVQTEKVKMDPMYIFQLALRLCLTCLVVAAMLGFVNMITIENITAAQNAAKAEALAAVIPSQEGQAFEDLEVTDELAAAALEYSATLSAVTKVTVNGENAGLAMTLVTSGSQGNIEMMVGTDADDAVTGVSIISNSETSGIGSKVMTNEPTASGTPVLDQFIGKAPSDGSLSVGSSVEAITGATVSTRGVTAGVNGALAVADLLD